MNRTKAIKSQLFFTMLLLIASPKPSLAAVKNSFSLTLRQAETQAQQNSGNIIAAMAKQRSAKAGSRAARGNLFPHLGIEGDYFYQTNVPSIQLSPLFPAQSFATHNNYTLGATLSYTLFDDGQSSKMYRSSKMQAAAQTQSLYATRRQVRYLLQTTYFRSQLALKNLELTAGSLHLAQAQDHDIEVRFHAGGSSQLDTISARQEVLSYELRFHQAQSQLAIVLRQLFSLTGQKGNFDSSRAIPALLLPHMPSLVNHSSLTVRLDPLSKTLASWQQSTSMTGHDPSPQLPELQQLEDSARAARLHASADRAGLWPKIGLAAKTELIYPDFVLAKQANNDIFEITLSIPVFDGNIRHYQAEQDLSLAKAAQGMLQQKQSDITQNFRSAMDQFRNLRAENSVTKQSVHDAQKIARLTYQAYRAGRVNFLDVQSVNLKLLQAQVQAAQVQEQMLESLAQMKYLSETNGSNQ